MKGRGGIIEGRGKYRRRKRSKEGINGMGEGKRKEGKIKGKVKGR